MFDHPIRSDCNCMLSVFVLLFNFLCHFRKKAAELNWISSAMKINRFFIANTALQTNIACPRIVVVDFQHFNIEIADRRVESPTQIPPPPLTPLFMFSRSPPAQTSRHAPIPVRPASREMTKTQIAVECETKCSCEQVPVKWLTRHYRKSFEWNLSAKFFPLSFS